MPKKVFIIGNGVSGVTAARHIRKYSDHEVTIISSETDHFYSRTALMYIYMGHMKFEHTKPYEDWFWEKNSIDIVRAHVNDIDFSQKKLTCDNGSIYHYDDLILGLGSKSNKFGWPGQDLLGVQGLYNMQDLELLEKNTHPFGTKNARVKHAVIVGGGLIGIELGEMLASRNIKVTFLIREKAFWGSVLPKGESELVSRHIIEHHMGLKRETELKEIIAGEDGRVSAIMTKQGERIDCEFVGLTPGVSPNIDWLRDTKLETGRGIKVDPFLETNIPNVYAIGDCAEQHEGINGRKPIEAVWYTGRMMGEVVAQTICGNRTAYNPGHWFNSAKFLDIEYQTYGWVFNEEREGEKHFYWEHANGKICMNINHEAATGKFIGLNVFGVRLRHEVIDKWLNEEKEIEYVLTHMKDANFDPEFYQTFEQDILDQYNKVTGKQLVLKKKSLSRIFG